MPYEEDIADTVYNTFIRNQATPAFTIELEEIIIEDETGEYMHESVTRVYGREDALLVEMDSNYLRSGKDKKPLAQKTLQGSIAYLEKKYHKNLFVINQIKIDGPTKPKGVNDRYKSSFKLKH